MQVHVDVDLGSGKQSGANLAAPIWQSGKLCCALAPWLCTASVLCAPALCICSVCCLSVLALSTGFVYWLLVLALCSVYWLPVMALFACSVYPLPQQNNGTRYHQTKPGSVNPAGRPHQLNLATCTIWQSGKIYQSGVERWIANRALSAIWPIWHVKRSGQSGGCCNRAIWRIGESGGSVRQQTKSMESQ